MNIIPFSTQLINDISLCIFSIRQNESFVHGAFDEYLLNKSFDSLKVQVVAQYLELLDAQFASSSERIRKYYVKQIRMRTVVTTLGPITFNRRQYIDRITHKYYYYIDEFLGLSTYQRLSQTLIFETLKMVTSYSYASVAKHFGISKWTVGKLIRNLKDVQFMPPSFIEQKTIHTLYIQADECYAALQKIPDGKKRKKYIVEEVVIHEGLESISKGRNRLINKTLFTRLFNESSKDFYKRIKAWIRQNYHYTDLYLYGDGAKWIKGCAKALDATFILDLFHTKQAVNHISRDKKVREFINTCLHKNKLDDFIVLFSGLQEMQYPLTKSNYRNYEYLVSNWKHIQLNFSLPNSVGCSQEGINFHYFASRLTTLPRGWSIENLRTIANLICLVKNNDTRVTFDELLQPVKLTLEDISKPKELLGPHMQHQGIEQLSNDHQYYRQAKLTLQIPRFN